MVVNGPPLSLLTGMCWLALGFQYTHSASETLAEGREYIALKAGLKILIHTFGDTWERRAEQMVGQSSLVK